MKGFSILLAKAIVTFVALLLFVNIFLLVNCGRYKGTEQEFVAILEGMEVMDCPSDVLNNDPWLYSKEYSIFPLISQLFFDYYFLKGVCIPKKYSHLVREKIERECAEKEK
jgi:hypothetical protein